MDEPTRALREAAAEVLRCHDAHNNLGQQASITEGEERAAESAEWAAINGLRAALAAVDAFDPLTAPIEQVDAYLRAHGSDPVAVGERGAALARAAFDAAHPAGEADPPLPLFDSCDDIFDAMAAAAPPPPQVHEEGRATVGSVSTCGCRVCPEHFKNPADPRRAALEEAARVAKTAREEWLAEGLSGYAWAASRIENRIRALANQPTAAPVESAGKERSK